MAQEKVENHRIPLPPKTKLTARLTIERLLSDCGGTSLTYIAKDDHNRTVVVKETYPIYTTVPLFRDGYRIVVEEESDAFKDELSEIETEFTEECHNANILCSTGDTNSIFHFECRDITDEVLEDSEFHGSIARYMTIATVSGRTLREIREEDDISLKQALLYTKKILYSLREMHNEPKRMLHLDLKDDNLFFPDQLSPEETFAIILDSASAQSIDHISASARFSISEGYAAKEIQLIKKYTETVVNEASAQKYRMLIGVHTDLYSVGAIAYRLIMQKAFNPDLWEEIQEEIKEEKGEDAINILANLHPSTLVWEKIQEEGDPNERTKLIRAQISARLEADYPYLVDRISDMLARALYFSAEEKKLLQNRYADCDTFAVDIDVILEILEQKGIHPEVVAAQSRKQFEKILRNANVEFEGDPVANDHLFVQEWFPTVVEADDAY